MPVNEHLAQTSTIRTAERRRMMSDRLGAALRGDIQPVNNPLPSRHEPFTEQFRGTAPQRIVGQPGVSADVPSSLYRASSSVAPTVGRHRKIRYREDWSADGSGFSDVHDIIAGGVRRYDTDGQLLLAASGNRKFVGDFHSGQPAAHDPWSVVRLLLAAKATVEEPEPKPKAATNRDLMRRTSKKQRLMLRAVRHVQEGARWYDLPKLMSVSRHEARELHAAVMRIAPFRREKQARRDVVGRFATLRKPPKSVRLSGLAAKLSAG